MPITTTTNSIDVLGDDVTTLFTLGFPVAAEADLVVTHIDASDVETLLVLDTDYTVSDVGLDDTASLTYPIAGSPLATGETLQIVRDTPLVQVLDLVAGRAFEADQIDRALSYLTVALQDQQTKVERSVKLRQTALPIEAVEGHFLSFDAAGQPITAQALNSGLAASSYMASLLLTANQSALLTALSANLASLAGLVGVADRFPYFTGPDVLALATPAVMRSKLDLPTSQESYVGETLLTADDANIAMTGLSGYHEIEAILYGNIVQANATIEVQARVSAGTWRSLTFFDGHTSADGAVVAFVKIRNFNNADGTGYRMADLRFGTKAATLSRSADINMGNSTGFSTSFTPRDEVWDELRFNAIGGDDFKGTPTDNASAMRVYGRV